MASSHGRRYLVSNSQDGVQPTGSSNISETTKHIIKIPTATTMFLGSTILVVGLPYRGTSMCAKNIQDGSHITGSNNNFADFTDTRRYKNNTGVYDYVRNIYMASSHGRRYLVSKIQDDSQLTGSSNMSETMTQHQNSNGYHYIFRVNLSSSVVVLPISWDVDVCQKSQMAAKLAEVVIT